MSTATTTAVYNLVRGRVADFTDGATTLASLGVGTRVYFDGAPDNAALPFLLLRVINFQTTEEFGDGIRATCDIEVMVFDAPRGQIVRARSIADHVMGALNQWHYAAAGAGFLKVTGTRAETLPKGTEDVNKDIVQVWLTFSAVLWSQMLARTFS